MLRTISLGSHVTVQGIFVRIAPNGNIVVRVDDTLFEGKPISSAA